MQVWPASVGGGTRGVGTDSRETLIRHQPPSLNRAFPGGRRNAPSWWGWTVSTSANSQEWGGVAADRCRHPLLGGRRVDPGGRPPSPDTIRFVDRSDAAGGNEDGTYKQAVSSDNGGEFTAHSFR